MILLTQSLGSLYLAFRHKKTRRLRLLQVLFRFVWYFKALTGRGASFKPQTFSLVETLLTNRAGVSTGRA